jgi:ribosomal protein S24E
MKIKITSQKQNPLLKRKEITFEAEHKETRGTPSRLEVREELASKLKKDAELVYIKKIETRTGTMTAAGEATAYDSVEQAKLVEPEHVIFRNTRPEEPEGEKREEKGEKKEEQKAEETTEEKGEREGEETNG